MNIQEFESFEQRIRNAECVEDVFGEIEPDAITLGEIKGGLLRFREETRYNKNYSKK